MPLNEATLFAFLLVFVRCSAMMLSSPIFGGNNIPTQIRVLTCAALSMAMTVAIAPQAGPLPANLWVLAFTIGKEVGVGLLIGFAMSLILQMAQMAGAVLDVQVGISMSQTLNPVDGVSSTVLSQFKYMLATVIFLDSNAHHLMIRAFIESYQGAPVFNPGTEQSMVNLLQNLTLIALEISAPILAVSLLVDITLGLVSKAVPQMQALQVGIPAKMAICLVGLSLCLPPLVSGVTTGTSLALSAVEKTFSKPFTPQTQLN